MQIRVATLDDAPAIREIYNHEVSSSTVTFDLVPRTLEQQRSWLTERSGVHVVLVAEQDGEVIGFGSLSPYRDRPAYSTTVEDSIYVHRERRRSGVGHAILAELVDRATAHGFHTVIARIVGGHEASIALHAALGFRHVGVEREVGRKFRQWLDVVEMQLLLASSAGDTG
jgi:L-amino acid N-acyltransferase